VSADGHWRVRAIVLDGRQRLRLEHDSPVVNGKFVTHWDGKHRHGPTITGRGWWLIGDMASVEQIEQYVPLDRLTPVKLEGQ
jgi:hypothetical protein